MDIRNLLPSNSNARVIVICGRPGTGKTTLARGVREQLGPKWLILDVDTPFLPLIDAVVRPLYGSLDAAYGSDLLATLRDAQYDGLFRQAAAILRDTELSVVLVGSFSTELQDSSFEETCAQRLDVEGIDVLEAWAPAEIVRDRLEKRGDFWDEMRLRHWHEESEKYSATPPDRAWTVIDASSTASTFDAAAFVAAAFVASAQALNADIDARQRAEDIGRRNVLASRERF